MNAKELFLNYTARFDSENGKIHLKIVHTLAVAEVMEKLAQRCALPEHTAHLAEIVAVFHDIGRFEQVVRYDTFLDHLSENHALLGIRVLREEGFLEMLSLSATEQEQVIAAIRNHNAYQIEDGLDPETLLLCRLIRDADKCDIFRVFAMEDMVDTMGETIAQVEQERISDEVFEKIMNRQQVPKGIRKTGLDIWVGFLGFFFDLNFDASFEILREERYYRRPFAEANFVLPETRERVAAVLAVIEDYVESRCETTANA